MGESRLGVLVVTGGSRGIGAAVARLGARQGYSVCVNFRARAAEATQLVRTIEREGGVAVAIGADVAVEADVVRLFQGVDEALGPVSALVNNVGIVGDERRVDEMDWRELQSLWSINVTSCFLCAREAIRRMSTRYGGRGGAIVNVSSLAGRLGGSERRVHYGASKGAVDAFTRGLATEVAADGIRVNAVAPGLIETEIHDPFGGAERIRRRSAAVPMRRPGTPDEAANAILWLLSAQASYVSGTVLDVSGGR